MKKFLKKHIGLVVLLVIVIAFPVSMSTQARLNMRIIVTGLAIDKTADGYEVTAQIVKTQPSSGSGDMGATVEFVSDTGETLVSAISKLAYRSGKVAGFSHTNFILLGKEILTNDLIKDLNYFLRDTVIKDSVLLAVAEESAKDEIKKTKDLNLSVGLSLQKVFVYKEKESDGVMASLLSFMNDSLGFSETAVLSTLSFDDGQSQNTSNEQSQSGQKSDKSSEEASSETESGGGESSASEKQSSSVYFSSLSPLACFVRGKYVGSLEGDEVVGFLQSENKCRADDISVENLNFGVLKNASAGIKVKYKRSKKKVRFEGDTPCLDITINIINSSIKEIQSDEFVKNLNDDEFEYLKNEISKKVAENVARAFEKSKQLKADVFGAFDIAKKHHYEKTSKNFSSMEEFLEKLKLNVNVNIMRLEY